MLGVSDATLCPPNTYTFCSEAHHSVSWLDHCVCNANLHSALRDKCVLYDYITSNHLPILITFDLRNHLMHADDVVLIAPSVHTLLCLLSYCYSFTS